MIQVAGAQVAGSVFLVMTVKYLNDKEKAIYIGIYNAVYYLAAAIGVFAGGFITSFDSEVPVPCAGVICVLYSSAD